MNREKWERFLRWPGWTAWLRWKLWGDIARWPGWTVWLKWDIWRKIGSWKGWNRLFLLPAVPVLLLAAAAGAGLAWVFLGGRAEHWTAVFVYVLAAYALTVLCCAVPGWIRWGRGFLQNNALAHRVVSDGELRFTVSLYFEQVINALYGIFKTASGVVLGSAWVGADGLYNLAQAVIQLVQILRRKKNLTLQQQWRSYRFCGWLVLAMHLTMTGLVYQMTRMGRSEEYPGYLILGTAAFVFYKLISAVVDVARDRKNKAPIDSSVMLLDLAQALFSVFSLQVAMIRQFEGSAEFAGLMNNITGTVVCLMVVCMGIYMLRRSRCEMKKLEETENGRV